MRNFFFNFSFSKIYFGFYCTFPIELQVIPEQYLPDTGTSNNSDTALI